MNDLQCWCGWNRRTTGIYRSYKHTSKTAGDVVFRSEHRYYELFHTAGISWNSTQKRNPKKDPDLVKKTWDYCVVRGASSSDWSRWISSAVCGRVSSIVGRCDWICLGSNKSASLLSPSWTSANAKPIMVPWIIAHKSSWLKPMTRVIQGLQ